MLIKAPIFRTSLGFDDGIVKQKKHTSIILIAMPYFQVGIAQENTAKLLNKNPHISV